MQTLPRGFDHSFNRNWTLIESRRNKSGEVISYVFTCGCGALKKFTTKHFVDPYSSAIMARERHQCEDLPRGIGRDASN